MTVHIKVESLESIRARLAEVLGHEPAAGLEVRMSGTDLTDPLEILEVADVLMMDLNAVLKRADELAARCQQPRIVPGLGRHGAKE